MNRRTNRLFHNMTFGLGVMTALGGVLAGTWALAASGKVLVHPFNSPNWRISTAGIGPSVQESKGRLVVTLPANARGETFKALVQWRPLIRGDFDARVDYRLLDWPAANGVKISLGSDEGSVQRVSEPSEGGEVYLTHFSQGGVAGNRPTTDASGKLRLARKGNVLTGYIYRNGKWIPLRAVTLAEASPVRIHLSAWGHDASFAGKRVRVEFDSFVLQKEGGVSGKAQ